MVSLARQYADIFTEKPRDPPDYKEDPDWTKDLERMEEELKELGEILVALSTRRSSTPTPSRLHPRTLSAGPEPIFGLCTQHKPPDKY